MHIYIYEYIHPFSKMETRSKPSFTWKMEGDDDWLKLIQ